MSSDNVADTDIIGWFKRRSLPITDGMMVKLTDFGVSLVEDLKLLENEFIEDLFKEAKPIEKIKANVAFKELKADKCSFTRCTMDLPLGAATSSHKTPTKSTRAMMGANYASVIKFKFTRTIIKTKLEKIAEREARERVRQEEARRPMEVDEEDEGDANPEGGDGGGDEAEDTNSNGGGSEYQLLIVMFKRKAFVSFLTSHFVVL